MKPRGARRGDEMTSGVAEDGDVRESRRPSGDRREKENS